MIKIWRRKRRETEPIHIGERESSLRIVDREYYPKGPFFAFGEYVAGTIYFPAFLYSVDDAALIIPKPSEDFKSLGESLFGDSELDGEEREGVLFSYFLRFSQYWAEKLAHCLNLRLPANLETHIEKLENRLKVYGDLHTYIGSIEHLIELVSKLVGYESELRWINADANFAQIKKAVDESPSAEEFMEKLDEKMIKKVEELKRYKELKREIPRLESRVRYEKEEITPSLDHYVDIRSLHGNIEVEIRDPYAIVDNAESVHGDIKINGNVNNAKSIHGNVEINPEGYKPQAIKRKINIRTTHGNIKVNYEPSV